MDTKVCKQCNEELPLDAFHRNTSMRDGHLSKCKRCVNSRKQERFYERRRNTYIPSIERDDWT